MKIINYFLILLILSVFTYSCKFNISGNDKDEEGEQGENFFFSPQPSDNATGVSLLPEFSWSYNSNTPSINCDIYLDTVNPPMNLIAQNISGNYYPLTSPLLSNKTYYWKLKTTDQGNTYVSNVWRFTTSGTGGEVFNSPFPADSATGVSLTPQLSWSYNGPSALYFTIFLDTVYPLTNTIFTTVTNNYYNIPSYAPLINNKIYYWKIMAYNYSGQIFGNTWRFSTGNAIPVTGLIAYYPFNGSAKDESGNQLNGTNYGATLTYDRFNNNDKAYFFNGINSYINVTHNSLLQPNTGLSVSVWFNFSSLFNSGYIIEKGYNSSAGYYGLKYDSINQSLNFQINFSDNTQKTLNINTYLNTNTWYNIIGTYDGNIMTVYFNGQYYNSIYESRTLGNNSQSLKIGSYIGSGFFSGTIDDIRIYNRGLNYTEVQQIYNESGRKIKK